MKLRLSSGIVHHNLKFFKAKLQKPDDTETFVKQNLYCYKFVTTFNNSVDVQKHIKVTYNITSCNALDLCGPKGNRTLDLLLAKQAL